MKAIIVDDEAPVRSTIKLLLQRWFPQVVVVGETASVIESVEEINRQQPDMLFLDIEIRGGTGFHVLQRLEWKSFKLIFITAFNDFAIQAIKMGALDYLLKPINEIEFKAGVEKALSGIDHQREEKVNNHFAHFTINTLPANRIVLRTSTDIHIVNLEEIIRCEADNTYTTFYFLNGLNLLVSKGLSEFEEQLSNHGFFRVHQSHMVNLFFVKRIEKGEGGSIHLSNGDTIPLSSRRKPQLLELLARS